jgi:tetratricopeptide (TPR) repeat protein
MPRPSKDPVFRWDYTYVDDDGFDDGRKPQAATLACRGVPLPTTVHQVARPTVTPRRSGPWWLSADPAAGGVYAHNVLKLAVYFGSVPILSRHHLAAAPDVEVTAIREIRVPVYDDDRHGHRLVQELRRRIQRLTSEAAAGRGEELLRDVDSALSDLREALPSADERTVRIGLAKFPYRPWREGPAALRVHPVILNDEKARLPTADDDAEHSESTIDEDDDLRHPMERVLEQLDAQDTSGVDGILGAPDLTADRAYALGVLLETRGAVDIAERAWRRADELGSAEGAYQLAAILRSRGEDTEGEAAAKRADERGSPSGAYLLGALQDQRGDAPGAEAAFRRGDERGNGAAAFRLGILLMQRGETDEGEAAFRRADERGHARAATALGCHRLRELGDLDGAEAAWRRADDRGDAHAAFFLGLQAIERGDEVGAEAAWRRGDERGDAWSAMQLGKLYLSKGNNADAEAAFQRAEERGAPVAFLDLGPD